MQPKGVTATTQAEQSYYGIPPIRAPHWRWLVINYFFLGALAGGSFSIATLADLFTKDRSLVRMGRYLSLAAVLPSPLLLALDLGRPERALHMFRIVKLKSPMSLGSWALLFLGTFSGLSALLQLIADARGSETMAGTRRVLGVVGLPFSLFIAGYTGLLLAVTNVPLWARNYLLMGPLFLASAFSSSLSALSLLTGFTNPEREPNVPGLDRTEMIVMTTELGLLTASLVRLGKLSRPLTAGRWGMIFWPITVGAGLITPITVGAYQAGRGETMGRKPRAVLSLLVLIGGYSLRMVMVLAGRDSANRPQDYFELTRRPGHDHTGAGAWS